MSGWGCPHEDHGNCRRVAGKACDPGMKGCTLFGKFTFSSDSKNISRRIKDKEDHPERKEKD